MDNADKDIKISLAQWSLHHAIQSGTMDKLDFAKKAGQLGFEAVEYVSRFYTQEAKSAQSFAQIVKEINQRSNDAGIKNLLIMIDGEGNLASDIARERIEAINNHLKWLEAAAELGCHSIRVNLTGGDETKQEKWINASTSSLIALSDLAKAYDLNVIVENHGGISSNGGVLARVMKNVNLPNVGTLPDLGNFCIRRQDGLKWPSPCVEAYDRYQGVTEMMPWAKGISAKTYDFNEHGLETTIDYTKMIAIIKNSGYNGYIGIEYEGQRLSEEEGIIKTKIMLENLLT
ncbi:sugar phosphate isomerase/epimerase family protein [Flavobacterium sp. RNTU_13]|uniref:sugar phosphate isomerase/epimerase family protein n=1 Tax=Flavobacterium sp. RNTU_13 TaxID=3375145 RepID=UPI003986D630